MRCLPSLVLIAYLMGVAGLVWSSTPQEEKLPAPMIETKSEKDITGVYSLEGVEEGKVYDGACVIRRLNMGKSGQRRDIVYKLEYAGGAIGIGIRDGNILSVSWRDGNAAVGLTTYRIEDKVLRGRWTTLPPAGELRTETMTLILER